MTDAQFARRVLVAVALVVAAAVVWHVADLLLLGFGAIVLAVVFRAGGNAIAAHTRLSPRWSTGLFLLLVVLVLAAVTVFVGDQVSEQFAELRRRLPEAVAQVRGWLYDNPLARSFLPKLDDEGEGVSASEAFGWLTVTFGAASHLIVVLLIAVYLSVTPGVYLHGVYALFPKRHRATLVDAADVSGHALRRWLLGQLVSMTAVGLLTGIGLWLAGVPLALVLGIVAGLLEFIPFAGPILAAIPGVLIALSVGPVTAFYAVLVYVVVQQLESALIMPLAQRWSVELPPALGLFGIIVFGLMFGAPGVLLATPLVVVIMVLVQRFWVER